MNVCRLSKRARAAALVAAALLSASQAHARIDLVTLPVRDRTEVTIYNSQDLTLVRETRTLPFAEGNNEIQFSWANTLIDPTSLRISFGNNRDLRVVDTVYPAGTRDLVVWNIEAPEAMAGEVEIRYFISGLTWNADYVVKANADETELVLEQSTTLRNNSGETFQKVNAQVVVGEVNLVELIAQLARQGLTVPSRQLGRAMLESAEMMKAGMSAPAAAGGFMDMAFSSRSEAREIIQKAISEYKVYTVEGEVDLENGWSQKLPNKPVSGIPFDLSYEIDPAKWGDSVQKFYKFENIPSDKLGKDAMPQGSWYVYTDDGRGGLRLEAITQHEYIPVGEDIELELGDDGLVLYKERVMAIERQNFAFSPTGDLRGWEELRTVELEINNTRSRAIPLKLSHYPEGDWELISSSLAGHDRVDQNTLRWETTIDAKTRQIVTLELRSRHGSLARR